MFKRIVFSLLGLVVTIAVIAGVYVLMIRQLIAAGQSMQMPPETVSVSEVRSEEWETILATVGSLAAVQGITMATEVEGVVREIAFTPGAVVEAGEVLVRLDTEVEESQLRAAQATADLAQANQRRARELFASRTISQAELDAAEAGVKQNDAQIASISAQLAKKTLRAPFTGRLGIREISLGQFLNKGEAVVSLQSFDPIFVEFSLPQQELSRLAAGHPVRVVTDAFPGEVFTGKITALNPQIDAATRNLRVQATLPNADGRLRPGLFATIDVVLPQMQQVLIVPATAVLSSPSGDSVYVVEPAEGDAGKGSVVRQRLVRVGEARGDFVVIVSGVKAGERVVRAGAFKLRNGAAVVESDVGVIAPSLTPTPKEG